VRSVLVVRLRQIGARVITIFRSTTGRPRDAGAAFAMHVTHLPSAAAETA
jgi:hypothetical protein